MRRNHSGPDLVVRGGTVYDGTGRAPVRADVAITGDTITAIGAVRESGRQEIDADGHAVTPGFIDGHTHMDAQVMWDPFGTSSCWHGVTTVVMGNCGFTLAPAKADERDLVVRNLERAEDIDAAALAAGIDWQWETFREYLDAVDRQPKGLNYAAYLGHSALRTWAMGERAFTEASTDADRVVMERELRDALAAGAIGFTTSRSGTHETSDDRPVASRIASWDEVSQLVHSMGDAGRGIFEIALDLWPDDEEREVANRQLQELAVTSGALITFGVLFPGGPGSPLELIDATTDAGGSMVGQAHSRGISVIVSFLTWTPFDALPVWCDVRTLPLDEQLVALREPELRAKLVEVAIGDHRSDRGARGGRPDFDRLRVLERPLPPNPTVAELARRRGVHPVELMLDLAVESDLQQLFAHEVAVPDDDALLAGLRHPRTVMTFSDAGAHVGQIADASIQTHFLGHWVRARQAFAWEEAVRMLTHDVATAWGFADRGLLREGFVADINVFDPETVGPALPTVEHDLPAGARRLVQKANGFLATVVGGQVVLREGEHTGVLPGRLLRQPSAR